MLDPDQPDLGEFQASFHFSGSFFPSLIHFLWTGTLHFVFSHLHRNSAVCCCQVAVLTPWHWVKSNSLVMHWNWGPVWIKWNCWLEVCSPSSCSKQKDHQYWIRSVMAKSWKSHTKSAAGQPMPVLCYSLSDRFFPIVQCETPKLHFVATDPC